MSTAKADEGGNPGFLSYGNQEGPRVPCFPLSRFKDWIDTVHLCAREVLNQVQYTGFIFPPIPITLLFGKLAPGKLLLTRCLGYCWRLLEALKTGFSHHIQATSYL